MVVETGPHIWRSSFGKVLVHHPQKRKSNLSMNRLPMTETICHLLVSMQRRFSNNCNAQPGISMKATRPWGSTLQHNMAYWKIVRGTLDTLINSNQGWVTEKPWMSGIIRTDYINRESVYQSFQNAISKA